MISQHNNNNITVDARNCCYYVSISPFTLYLHQTPLQFLPTPFPCQPCCDRSCIRQHSPCCHSSISRSSFWIFLLDLGTVLFMFITMFTTKYATSVWWCFLVCLLSLAIMGIPSEAAQQGIINVKPVWYLSGSGLIRSSKIIVLTAHTWGVFGPFVGAQNLA